LPGPGPTSHTSMHGVFQPHARPFMEGASSGIPIRDIAPAPSSSSQSRRPSDLPSGVVYSATHAGSSYAPRPTRLVGPGVPGDEVLPSGRMISPPPSTYPHPGRASVSGHGGYTTHSEGHSQSDNRARPEETVYRQRSSAHLQSVQLPPLHLDSRIARERRTSHDTQQAGSRALHSPPIPPSTAGHSASPYSSRHRVLPPLHVPEQAPQPLSRPYALEPNPQWHSDRGMHTSGEFILSSYTSEYSGRGFTFSSQLQVRPVSLVLVMARNMNQVVGLQRVVLRSIQSVLQRLLREHLVLVGPPHVRPIDRVSQGPRAIECQNYIISSTYYCLLLIRHLVMLACQLLSLLSLYS
jgi:hypothetical protein